MSEFLSAKEAELYYRFEKDVESGNSSVSWSEMLRHQCIRHVTENPSVSEGQNRFIIDAINAYRPEKVHAKRSIVTAIVMFLPVMLVHLVFGVLFFFKSAWNYIRYGGESIVYDEGDRATMVRLFKAIIKEKYLQ